MVYLLKDYGFCAGVKNSIDTLKKASEESSSVSLLLPLMHNERENEKQKRALHFKANKEDVTDNDAIVFPAHGHTKEDEVTFSTHNCYDAICPVLKSRYQMIQNNKDLIWYYLGKKNHQETKAFLSHFPFLNYIDLEAEINQVFPNQPSALIVQSTMSEIKAEEVHKALTNQTDLKIYLPPCSVYLNRKKEAIDFLSQHDSHTFDVIVLGSKTSSNCSELFDSIQSLFPYCYIAKANCADDIDLSKLNKENILLVSSTSISEESVMEIKDFLEKKKSN